MIRRALLLALCLQAACAWAAKVVVVEAVIPDWPKGQTPDQIGKVVVDFVLAPRGDIFITGVEAGGLPGAFVEEARLALRDWLITDDGSGGCGLIHGRQEFLFDGRTIEPVALGATQASLSGEGAPIASLDRVEIFGGRIARRDSRNPLVLEQQYADEKAYSEKLAARWRVTLARSPQPAYAPVGMTSPAPKVRIEPQFPHDALADGRSGVVASRLSVDTLGKVTHVDVVDSYPRGTFDQTSRGALMRWRMTPATDAAGKATNLVVCQVLSFSIVDHGRFRQGGY